MRLNIKIVIN